MTCLGCQRCEDGPVVTTHDGRTVCNICPDWREECEARGLLMLSLTARRAFLAQAEDKRGKAATDDLKAMMATLHGKRVAA